MNDHFRGGLAAKIAHVANAMLPPELKDWGAAMRCEVASIPTRHKAVFFAIGCLFFAFHQRMAYSRKQFFGGLIAHRSRMVAWCAILATGLGLLQMAFANAPIRLLIMNVGALGLGFAIVGIATLVARKNCYTWGPISLVLAALVMLTTLFGVSTEGATRWISLGGVSIQSSLLVVPILAIAFAREQSILTTVAIVLTSFALAVQPDRGMSGALAAGMVALVIAQPSKRTLIASCAGLGGFLVAMVQADTLPAMPHVDQVYYSSFAVHPIAGVAVLLGAVLLLVPAFVGKFGGSLDPKVCTVFGAVWGAISLAAALGNYPTPIVGYGGSAIIGYVICMLGFAAPKRREAALEAPTSSSDQYVRQAPDLRTALA
jgi:cell division protein FtsW (lipid II flippase)